MIRCSRCDTQIEYCVCVIDEDEIILTRLEVKALMETLSHEYLTHENDLARQVIIKLNEFARD